MAMINVEVAYALPQRQQILTVEVEEGTSVFDAVELSGIVRLFPEIDLATAKMGVFGKVVSKPHDTPLAEGDRVEIYRPLIIDPKQVRKQRAERAKAEKATPAS